MRCERCYKPAYTPEQAVQMIRDGQCGAFNPLLLDCLSVILDRRKDSPDFPADISGDNVDSKELLVTDILTHSHPHSAGRQANPRWSASRTDTAGEAPHVGRAEALLLRKDAHSGRYKRGQRGFQGTFGDGYSNPFPRKREQRSPHVGPRHSVSLYNLKLLIGKLTWLIQNFLWNRHLSDIMQSGCIDDLKHHFCRKGILVDDSRFNRLVMTSMLAKDYFLEEACDGKQAMRILQDHAEEFSLILCLPERAIVLSMR